MTSPSGVKKIESASNLLFKNIGSLKGEEIELRLKNTFLYTEANIPGYEFDVLMNGENAGVFTALIEADFNKIAMEGNVGIILKEKFFGKDLPVKVMQIIYQLFDLHSQKTILITFDENTNSLQTACEKLGAKFLDTMPTESNLPSKKRYILQVPKL